MGRLLTFLFTMVLPFAPAVLKSMFSAGAVALGMGTALYTGFNFLFDDIIRQVNSTMGSLPADVLQMMKLMGVSDMLNIYLSGGFALLVYKGMRNGAMRRQVWRKPGNKDPIDWEA
ncbi:TPA: DUF2523 family protein [Photobacterium damselae]